MVDPKKFRDDAAKMATIIEELQTARLQAQQQAQFAAQETKTKDEVYRQLADAQRQNAALQAQIATMAGHPDVVAAARVKKEQEYKAMQERMKAMAEELETQP